MVWRVAGGEWRVGGGLCGVLDRFVSDDGTFAASTWEWTETNAYSKPFDLPIALIDEYRNGKIVKQTAYYASPDSRQLVNR